VSSADQTVSVIVPARNARQDLERLVEALRSQTLARERFEVLIGDDGSTDGTAETFATREPWLRVEVGVPSNSYAARNRAARASRGDVLAFVDSDCVPEPTWLEDGLGALVGADLVAGRVHFRVPLRRTIWTLLDMDTSKNQRILVRNNTAETANLFVRRDVFDRVGGFDETINEHGDFDFAERCVGAGARLVYSPDPLVWHPARTSARSFFRAHWIYCSGYAERCVRNGARPDGLKLRNWVPLVQPLLARRRYGKSFVPDRAWLAENGVRPTAAENLLSLPVMYLVLPYVRGVAQLHGWWRGRKTR
jgi:GT2 family glycosyltransferase